MGLNRHDALCHRRSWVEPAGAGLSTLAERASSAQIDAIGGPSQEPDTRGHKDDVMQTPFLTLNERSESILSGGSNGISHTESTFARRRGGQSIG